MDSFVCGWSLLFHADSCDLWRVFGVLVPEDFLTPTAPSRDLEALAVILALGRNFCFTGLVIRFVFESKRCHRKTMV